MRKLVPTFPRAAPRALSPAKGIDMTVRWPFVIGTSLLILNEVRGVAVVAMVLLGIGHV
jgi:hypothetical protein